MSALTARLSEGPLRALARDSVIYGLAAVANKALALVTFPILARYYGAAGYGTLDLLLFAINWAALVVIFGQDSAVARFLHEHGDDPTRAQIVSQSLLVQAAVLLPVACVLLLLAEPASRLSGAAVDASLLHIAVLQMPALVLLAFCQSVLRWTFQRRRFLCLSLGSAFGHAALLITVLSQPGHGIAAALWVGLSVQTAFALLGLWFIRGWLVRPRRSGTLPPLLRLALPYGVVCIVGGLVPLGERSLVAWLLGSEALGLYAAGSKIAMVMALLGFAFQSAWGPFSLAIHKAEDAAQTYSTVFALVATVSALAALALSALAQPLLILLAGERFAAASVVVLPLALGIAFQSAGWITEVGITISKRSYLSLYAYGAFIAVAPLCAWLLGRSYGLAGVAFGVMIGQATLALCSGWLAHRAYPVPWRLAGGLRAFALAAAVAAAAQWAGATLGAGVAQGITAAGAVLIALCAAWVWLHPAHRPSPSN